MSTRSRIGIKGPDQVRSIYCHWDGYPTNNGRLLLEHWSDETKLQKLMELGDLSSLGTVIGQQHDFDAPYDSPERHPEWCLAYGRDRGEDVRCQWHGADEAWPDSSQEWEYLFIPGEGWKYREVMWKKIAAGESFPPDHREDTYELVRGEWAPLTAEFIEGEAAKEAAVMATLPRDA